MILSLKISLERKLVYFLCEHKKRRFLAFKLQTNARFGFPDVNDAEMAVGTTPGVLAGEGERRCYKHTRLNGGSRIVTNSGT